MKRLLLLLAALLACGLIAAGCGDDDDDDGGDDSPATTETAPPADTTESDDTESEDSGDDSGDTVTPPANVDQAVEACKESVQASGGQLSDDVVADLEDLCEEAAEGDEDDIREASLEICRKIVEDTVPAGATRDQALDACEASVPTP
ncbi:MAG TPA: hypothetical protein VD790_11885 [Thermoleophilaceae bacterium]|nr:hypothetical protein [Thermoleophilaceae bacterium]